MAAVLFTPLPTIQKAVEQLTKHNSGLCEVTNLNSPSQTVVSGERAQLLRLQSVLRQLEGGKRARAVFMNVKYPFHSSLLKSASDELESYVRTFNVKDPLFPVLSNLDGSLVWHCCGFVRSRWNRRMPFWKEWESSSPRQCSGMSA